MNAPMNRQSKRIMAKQGTDKPRPSQSRQPAVQKERTGPRQYYREVVGEMRKVAWPTAKCVSTDSSCAPTVRRVRRI